MMMMLPQSLLLLTAPILTRAIVVLADSGSAPATLTHDLDSVHDDQARALQVEVPCQVGGESFYFSIESTSRPGTSACGHSQLRINGATLERKWSQDGLGHSSILLGQVNVTAENSARNSNSTLSLQTRTLCLAYGADNGSLVEVTTYQIVGIDAQPSTSIAGFTTSLDTSQQRLNGNTESFDLEVLFPLPSTTVSEVQPLASTPVETAFEIEIKRLRQLEENLKGIQNIVDGQRRLVNDLSDAQHLQDAEELKQCENVSCVLKAIYHKAKGCVREMYLRYGPKEEESLNDAMQDIACASSSRISGNRLCANKPLASLSTSNTSRTASTLSISSSSTPTTQPTCNQKTHTLRIALDILACLLTISTLAALLHAHLCSPRRRADRLARREERRTALAYRRLARKEAWKNWWNRRLLRRDTDPRARDYEEKRALICGQEAVLEGVMQQEIRALRQAEGLGDELAGAEEGRAPIGLAGARWGRGARRGSGASSEGVPPPTYRSRASSARPPSYVEFDGRVRGNVADGFEGYTPSGTTGTPEGTDCTPDSSVMDLSPRQSSESLRTERSAF